MTDSISVARSELAPTGTLRVALNMSNFLLTATDPVSGEPCGIAEAEGKGSSGGILRAGEGNRDRHEGAGRQNKSADVNRDFSH